MLIKRQSIFTGAVNVRDIDISEAALAAWQGGDLIQNVAPHLSADDREFLISGTTPEEWDEFFPQEPSDG